MLDCIYKNMYLILFVLLILENVLFAFRYISRTVSDKLLERNSTILSERKYAKMSRFLSKKHIYENVFSFLIALNMVIFGFLMALLMLCEIPVWAICIIVAIVLLIPVTPVTSFTGRLFLSVWGLKHISKDDVTEQEIISMVNEGQEQGFIESSEAEMINNIFEFGDKEAKDIMTNRSNIRALDCETPLKDAVEYMLGEQFSRFPVYEENLDHIIGILNLKDAVRYQSKIKSSEGKLKNHRKLLRKATFIPETKNIDDLFQTMRADKTPIAVIIDEYGQTSGLLAMEDILEEIVGNIMDEYDVEDDYIEETGDEEYEIEGLTPLEELEEELGIVFDTEDFETLNGFMISKLEHIPRKGEKFSTDYGGYSFTITESDDRIVKSVHVKKISVPENEDSVKEDSEIVK